MDAGGGGGGGGMEVCAAGVGPACVSSFMMAGERSVEGGGQAKIRKGLHFHLPIPPTSTRLGRRRTVSNVLGIPNKIVYVRIIVQYPPMVFRSRQFSNSHNSPWNSKPNSESGGKRYEIPLTI